MPKIYFHECLRPTYTIGLDHLSHPILKYLAFPIPDYTMFFGSIP